MKKFYIAFTMFVVLGMLLSACGGTATADNKLE